VRFLFTADNSRYDALHGLLHETRTRGVYDELEVRKKFFFFFFPFLRSHACTYTLAFFSSTTVKYLKNTDRVEYKSCPRCGMEFLIKDESGAIGHPVTNLYMVKAERTGSIAAIETAVLLDNETRLRYQDQQIEGLMRRCLACEAEIETLKRENESLKK
jgi:DNA-directed RNA polymerase subunit RPC12/RpoP